MALSFDLTLSAFQSDCSLHYICDTTIYGAPEVDRNTRGNYLIASYKDVDGNPTYVTATAENADPTAVEKWSFDTPRDSRFEFILLSTDLYSGVTTYNIDDVITYTDGKPYIAVQDGFNGITPDAVNGSDYWTLVSDYKTIVDNESILQYVYEDIIVCRLDNALRDLLEKAIDKGLCSKECSIREYLEDFDQLELMLTGIHAKNWEGKMSEAEELIRTATDFADIQC